MIRLEEKFIDYLKQHCEVLFLICISLLGIAMRYTGRDFISDDYTIYLGGWYEQIKDLGGFKALEFQVGNYNILYQMIIAFLTYLPIEPLYAYKLVSCIGDFFLAAGCGLLACEVCKNKNRGLFLTVYSVVLIMPTMVMNSAYWAQCDSLYVSFIIFALVDILKGKNHRAFILLGIALALKFQMIFVLPFLLFFYVLNKKYSIFHFLWVLVVAMLTTLPAIVYGRGWFVLFQIYWAQHSENPHMTMNYPNIWAIMGGDYTTNKPYAVFLVIAILGIGLFLLVKKNYRVDNTVHFMSLLIWTVWTCLMFMPVMHERYGYLLEVLLVVMCFMNVKKYWIFGAGIVTSTLLTYSHYLYGAEINLRLIGVACFLLYCAYTFDYFSASLKEKETLQAT